MVLCKKIEEVHITRKFILERLSPYDIYRWEYGEFTVGRPCINHLRGEKRASFTIFQGQDGRMHHYDQADDYWKGDCFDIVCQKYGITLIEALKKIAKDFMLVDAPVDAYKQITSQYVKPVLDPKRYALIQCTTKKFTSTDMTRYWDRYRVISKDKLKKHNVYSLREVFLNRKKIPIGKDELVYGYWYPNGWKIMFPERPIEQKWLSNISLDTPEGLENLSKDHNSLLVKSKKCYMVMEEVYPYLCTFQNETIGSVTEKVAQYINENSKKVFYGGDSDVAGKKASYKITEKYQWYHVNVPDKYLPDKDWSDLSASHGIEVIDKHLRKKGVII